MFKLVTAECSYSYPTKREAEIYAFWMAYNMPWPTAVEIAPTMQIGKEYNYSESIENPLIIKIEVVAE